MAWERRGKNGNRYFYRSFRDAGGKVRKRYYGRGPMGQLAANLGAAAQTERKAAAEDWQKQKQQHDAVSAAVEAFCEECDLLLSAVMLAAGYHEHRGQWRRRRAG